PLDLDRRAEVLASGAPRLVVVDDLDRGGRAAVEVLPVLAARVAGSATAVVVTAAEALGTGQEIRVGPLGEDDLGALVGEDRPEVRPALWLGPGGVAGAGPPRRRSGAAGARGLAGGAGGPGAPPPGPRPWGPPRR